MPYKDPEERRGYERRRRAAKREEIASYQTNWRAENRERVRAYDQSRRLKDPAKFREANKRYLTNHPERRRASCRAASNKATRNLTDAYVRSQLAARSSLRSSDIPADLVALKRLHLKLKRELASSSK